MTVHLQSFERVKSRGPTAAAELARTDFEAFIEEKLRLKDGSLGKLPGSMTLGTIDILIELTHAYVTAPLRWLSISVVHMIGLLCVDARRFHSNLWRAATATITVRGGGSVHGYWQAYSYIQQLLLRQQR